MLEAATWPVAVPPHLFLHPAPHARNKIAAITFDRVSTRRTVKFRQASPLKTKPCTPTQLSIVKSFKAKFVMQANENLDSTTTLTPQDLESYAATKLYILTIAPRVASKKR